MVSKNEPILPQRKIIIVAGHYGAGKTNIAVNLALHMSSYDSVSLIDFDTVNPYFRAADAKEELIAAGVRPIIPEYANTNVDIPSLPPETASVFVGDGRAIFDVGGDEGAIALGVYEKDIKACGYDMIYVVNMYRPLTATPEDAVFILREIEEYSRLRFTGIVNNSNIGRETAPSDIIASIPYADRISELTGLPLIFTSILWDKGLCKNTIPRPFYIKNETKQLF
jgi:hypothetical protein